MTASKLPPNKPVASPKVSAKKEEQPDTAATKVKKSPPVAPAKPAVVPSKAEENEKNLSRSQKRNAAAAKREVADEDEAQPNAAAMGTLFGKADVNKVDANQLFAKAEPAPKPERNKHTTPAKTKRKSHLNDAPDVEENRRTVFVGNLPNNCEKAELKKLFRDCGDIECTRIRNVRLKEEEDKKRGRAVRCLRGDILEGDQFSSNGFVVFKKMNSCDAAVKLSGTVFKEHHINVAREDPSGKVFAPINSLFIGNLHYDVSDEEVWRFFTDKGFKDTERVRVIRDRTTGLAQGFGYVSFKGHDSVKKALELRQGDLHGRKVRLCHVQKSKDPKLAAAALSRREKRQRGTKDDMDRQGPATKKEMVKKFRTEGTAANKTSERRAAAVASMGTPEAASAPAWMGQTSNPRKKLAKDLRPLTQSNADRKKMLREKAKSQQGAGLAKKKEADAAKKAEKKAADGPRQRKEK
jgi:nucleolar protein 12